MNKKRNIRPINLSIKAKDNKIPRLFKIGNRWSISIKAYTTVAVNMLFGISIFWLDAKYTSVDVVVIWVNRFTIYIISLEHANKEADKKWS